MSFTMDRAGSKVPKAHTIYSHMNRAGSKLPQAAAQVSAEDAALSRRLVQESCPLSMSHVSTYL